MILSDDEIQERIESPLNLLNRLRKVTNTSLAIPHNKSDAPASPCLPPKASDIIDDLEDKLSKTSTRHKATEILHAAMDELKTRMPEIQKPERLATIAAEMSKVVANQQAKQQENQVLSQIVVYAPQVQNIENYEIIEVVE